LDKVVKIGGGSAFFGDSSMATPQLLAAGVDYLVYDNLSESVTGTLARQMRADPEAGWVTRFIDVLIGPHLAEIQNAGVKVISNAGGVNPAAAARAIRKRIADLGLNLKVAAVEGDSLSPRLAEFAAMDLSEMFSGQPFSKLLIDPSKALSLTVYTGAFPIAQALATGADIVVTGRAVDSALSLGPLIHEFGWGTEDFDLLSAGTAIGHLLECGVMVAGGTFTDWQDVPDWENLGFPIGECRADGSVVMTKPEGTGGLVSVGGVTEQLLYEVRDVGSYVVPDVVCDWTQVRLEQLAPNRVRVSGAKGLSRSSTYKLNLTYDDGYRGVYAMPVFGADAVLKAERIGQAMLKRTAEILRGRNLGAMRRTHVEILGAETSYGHRASPAMRATREAICRVSVETDELAAAEAFKDETMAFMNASAGASMPLQSFTGPVQHLACFLVEKSLVQLFVSTADGRVAADVPSDGAFRPSMTPHEPMPAAPTDAGPTVPLVDLAWMRSGDKADLFNLAVIAREPQYLPYLAAALSEDAVRDWYAHVFNPGAKRTVERQHAPGPNALNIILHEAVGGGIGSNLRLDSPGKGMGQQLLDFPVPVSPAIAARLSAKGGEPVA
jgi:hypothetical protein